jgi:exodeoxyribonuclease V gamma subunit
MTPSVVLAEFLDYLQAGFEIESEIENEIESGKKPLDTLFSQHPLQPFNPSYFKQGSPLYSFNKDWLQVHHNKQGTVEGIEGVGNLASVDYELADVLMEDFIQFYQNPSKDFLSKVLNINLSIWAQAQENDEPFDLDQLTLFNIKSQLLEKSIRNRVNNNESAATLINSEFTAGRLAYGEIGEKQAQKIEAAIAPILSQCEIDLVNPVEQPLEINVNIRSLEDNSQAQPVSILGWLSNIYNDQLIMVIPSKLKAKHVVKLLLEHSLLCAMGHQFNGKLICQDTVLTIKPMARPAALEYIKVLLEYYISSRRQPLNLLPQTAWDLKRPANQGGKEYNHALNSLKAFTGVTGPFSMEGERDDLHVIRCFGELENIPEETMTISDVLYDPWVELMEIVNHD